MRLELAPLLGRAQPKMGLTMQWHDR